MKHLRRLLTGLLCLGLLLGITAVGAGAAPTVYFMAVNERLVETTPQNMPMLVGGTLYVPYTMLSIQDTGINLGVSAQYSPSRNTTMVSDGRRGVAFNLQDNTAYDFQGNPVAARAVMRNSMVFLPIAWVRDYFGIIRFTTSRTPYGTLVRITSDAAILSDAALIDAADSQLRDNLARYQQAVNAQQPSAPPTASVPPSPILQPDSGPVVRLAFLWGDGAQAVARQLTALGTPALFLFTPDQLAQQDDLVRQLAAQGHSIGLDLAGETTAQCLQQARQGSQLLADIAHCPAYIVRAAGLDRTQRSQLAQAGWAVWTATLSWGQMTDAGQLLRTLNPSQANYVEALCSSDSLPALTSAIQALAGEDYRLEPTLATVL